MGSLFGYKPRGLFGNTPYQAKPVRLGDGTVVSPEAIGGILGANAPARQYLAPLHISNKPKPSMYGPKPRPQGSISAYNPSWAEKAQQKLTELISGLGVDRHEANRHAARLTSFLNDLTPAGNVADFADAKGSGPGADLQRAIAMLPLPGPERKAVHEAIKGIRAFHGSPHDFDRFDLSKIGSGEGAQAYGHGLYFAQNADVARAYLNSDQKTMSAPANHWISQAGGDWSKARQMFTDFIGGRPSTEAQREVLDLLTKKDHPGHLYEVNIKANPDDLLDWDAPLAGQSPQVQQRLERALGNVNIHPDYAPGPDTTGERLYRTYLDASTIPVGSPYSGLSAKRAPQMLKDVGIPGVRYLDQGSRHGAGTGTRNFVMFDDKLIDILSKK